MPFSLNPYVGLLALVSMITLSGCSRDNPLNLAQVPTEDPVKQSCEELLQKELDQYPHIVEVDFSEPPFRDEFNNLERVYFYDNLIDSIRITPSGEVGHLLEILGGQQRLIDLYDSEIANLTMKVGEESLEVGDASEPIALTEGRQEVIVKVTAQIKVLESKFLNKECLLGEEEEEEEEEEEVQVIEGTGEEAKKYVTGNLAFDNSLFFERLPLVRATLPDVDEAGQILRSIEKDDEFGRSVAIAGDFLAVGVMGDDSSGLEAGSANNDALDAGAVYIYKRSTFSNPWVIHSYLKASNAGAGDQFGYAVALEKGVGGNYLLVVSAPGEDSLASGIYAWEDDNGDGINDHADGAAAEVSNLATDSGALYVFNLNAGSGAAAPQQIAYVKPQFNTPGVDGYNNAFGSRVLLRDGVLLVSAPKEDSQSGSEADASLPDSGAVYVYQYEDNTQDLQYHQVLKANVPGQGDGFGQAIALYQDDPAEQGRIVVGAPGEDSDSDKVIPGRVDSLSDLAEGDARSNNDALDSGAVYVFDRVGNTWNWKQSAYIKAPNNDAGDLFGSALGLADSGLWVGAPSEASNGTEYNRNMGDNSATDSGAVYRYSLIVGTSPRPDSWVSDLYVKPPVVAPGAKFGSSVVIENNDLIVGAPFFENNDNASQGHVFGYQLNLVDGSISLDYQFSAEDGQENARFGRSLAISGTTFVVGSNGHENKESATPLENSGRAFVYQ